MICWQNAAKTFHLDTVERLGRENCTIGALGTRITNPATTLRRRWMSTASRVLTPWNHLGRCADGSPPSSPAASSDPQAPTVTSPSAGRSRQR